MVFQQNAPASQEELEDEDAELEPWEDSEVFEDREMTLSNVLGGEEAVEIDHPNIFQYIMVSVFQIQHIESFTCSGETCHVHQSCGPFSPKGPLRPV